MGRVKAIPMPDVRPLRGTGTRDGATERYFEVRQDRRRPHSDIIFTERTFALSTAMRKRLGVRVTRSAVVNAAIEYLWEAMESGAYMKPKV